MKLLGISGDPTGKGTVTQLVQMILDSAPTDDKELLTLSDFNIRPCQGCFGCIRTNRCVQTDDWTVLSPKVSQAETLVLGLPIYYAGVNALTHTFLERWFALRHLGFKLNLKKIILAIASGTGQVDNTTSYLKTFFETYHGINDIETIVAQGPIPCLVCGEGENCPISFVVYMHGKGTKITPDMLPSLAKQSDVTTRAKTLGKTLG